MADSKRGKLLQSVGPWLLVIGCCSLLDSILRGGEGKQQWPLKLQLNLSWSCARSSWPCTQQEIQDQISLCSEWWRGSRTLTTRRRGRARDNHLIPTPRWAVSESLVNWLLQGSQAIRVPVPGCRHWLGIGKRTETLWKWLLSSMRERYLYKDDLSVHQDKWNTMEQHIQYLRESAVLEVICKDSKKEQFPVNPDDIQCTQTMCWKFLWSTLVSCVSSLVLMPWKGGDQKVDNLVPKLLPYEETISSLAWAYVSSMERLSKEWKNLN